MHYPDLHDNIKEFFLCSLSYNFTNFDFSPVFEETERSLHRHLLEHGQLGPVEDHGHEYFQEFFFYPEDSVSTFTVQNPWITIDAREVLQAISDHRYNRYRNWFKDWYSELEELYSQLQDRDELTLHELIALYDSCIHAKHQTGWILQDVGDPDDIRADAEEEFKDSLTDQIQAGEFLLPSNPSISFIRNSPAYI